VDSGLVRMELLRFLRDVCPKVVLMDGGSGGLIDWSKLARDFMNPECQIQNPPYLIVEFYKELRESEWGLGNVVYSMEIDLFYVEFSKKQSFVERGLNVLRDRLLRHRFDKFQVLDVSAIDFSLDQKPNQFFMKHTVPLQGGKLSFRLIFGECFAGVGV
jgi:hypothetical protein